MSIKEIIVGSHVEDAAAPEVISSAIAPYEQRRRVVSRERQSETTDYKDLARLIHTTLRGRYLLAIFLGLITGSAAAWTTARLVRPKYHSEALLRIAYTLPQVLQETDQNGPLAMFEAFITSQKILITSRRVVDLAIGDPIWKTAVREVPKYPDRYFAENLKVEIKPRSEFIQVSFTDPDPATAAAAVNATVKAYSQVYNTQDKQLERQRFGVLEEAQKQLQVRIDQLTDQIKLAADGHGIAALDQFYDGAASRVLKLDTALADLRLAIATASADRAGAPAGPPPEETELPPEQIAKSDPVMAGYLQELVRCERDLERVTQGLGEKHPIVALAKSALDNAGRRMEAYARLCRAANAANTANAAKPLAVSAVEKPLSKLKSDEANLEKLRQQGLQEMLSLEDKKHDLLGKQQQFQSLQDQMTEMTRRIQVLRAEGSFGGRLSIISNGEIPISPEKDHRMIYVAAAGSLGGLIPAAALVLLSFLSKHNYRYSQETEVDTVREAPLLGILPLLSDGAAARNAELMRGAAYGMHQIRVALGSPRKAAGARSYLVTSAAAGDGKTSLTMSLGLSFASCRMRTLIIDCDLIGRKLTRNLDACDIPGLTEAIDAGSMRPFAREIVRNLSVLTTGDRSSEAASALPVAGIRLLLAEARKNFDVILVDSGPILGSIEAAVVAQEVDGTILTISRGQERGMVAKAVRQLNWMGVNIAGMIFNRARPEDFARSPYSSSSRSANPDLPAQFVPPRGGIFGAFGPVVQAVAADVFVASI